ncbi:CPII coat sec24 protein [Roridomyces roridus]|uniref:CPII coat sec24 protein n=1 Tax=Roridomyces roridus TaxID=1738132 RepID=A0AAD7FKZ8_9AGAR|nr:CPII coat sec24 protein [Roridomyces roridus]
MSKPKSRQYAVGQTQVYYGSPAGQLPADDGLTQTQMSYGFAEGQASVGNPPTTPSDLHVDLMTYPPHPRDLRSPSHSQIRLPSVIPSEHMHSGQRYMTPTLGVVPNTEPLLHKAKIPLGLVVSPYPTIDGGAVPAVEDGVIARCHICRAYMNPYIQFLDNGRRWRCSLCGRPNDVPELFDWSVVVNQPRDRYTRAELNHPVVDYVATSEYVRQAPQAPAYVFVLDVSQEAVSSGMFSTAIHMILENLDDLPNEQKRTRVAIICYDTALHFFSIRPGADMFDMLVVSDLEEKYLPRPYQDLLVNLSEARQVFETLLSQLSAIFSDSRPSQSATGPALNSALALLTPVGGKIVLISASTPSVGMGTLDISEQRRKAANQKELDEDKPTSNFYHTFSLSCVNSCVSVDMFVFGDRYRGLGTLSIVPQYTSGQMFYYRDVAEIKPKFTVELGRVLAMPILLEAEMRMRCSRGICVQSIDGNFFLSKVDSVVMPAVAPNQSYAVEFQIQETLTEPIVVFQCALLHTTCTGERRIRVLTLALPTTSVLSEVFASADAITIATLIAKQSVQRPSSLTLEDRRDKIVKRVAEMCVAYNRENHLHSSELQLRLPVNLKMLPAVDVGLAKKAIQVTPETTADMRAYVRALISSSSASQFIRYIYPKVYSLHNMPVEVGFIGEHGKLLMPAPLPLTSAWWEPHGLYLLDDGHIVYLWVGRDAVPQLIVDVFGLENYQALQGGMVTLPELDTTISNQVRSVIDKIREREDVIHFPAACVVKDDSASGNPSLRATVVQWLIHDRTDDLRMSYKQFLLKIYGKDHTSRTDETTPAVGSISKSIDCLERADPDSC